MNAFKRENLKEKSISKEKILLGLMPIWDPLIPPLGISYLKSFIQNHGYHVKTMDANVEWGVGDIHKK